MTDRPNVSQQILAVPPGAQPGGDFEDDNVQVTVRQVAGGSTFRVTIRRRKNYKWVEHDVQFLTSTSTRWMLARDAHTSDVIATGSDWRDLLARHLG